MDGTVRRRSVTRLRQLLEGLRQRSEVYGVLDYGLASLATFLVGLFAAGTLSPRELGVYALCFRAVFLGGVVPSHGVFLPAENLLVTLPLPRRMGALRHTLRLGVPAALTSALLVVLWVFLAPPDAPREALVALTVTGIGAAFFSPLQDHVRRMLHLSGASRVSAFVSLVQFVVVAATLLGARALHVTVWWVPFGALALANLASMLAGIVLHRPRERVEEAAAILRRDEIRRSGRWLVMLALLDAAAVFAVAALVANIAGSSDLGYAEAARIAAHPMMVLAWGLSAVLGPRSLRAAREGEAEQATTIRRTFGAILMIAGVVSLAMFALPWWGNPMVWLLPTAYVVPGLVGLSILAYLANGLGYPMWSELLGGRKERAIAHAELLGGGVRIIVAATAAATRAYAVPLSLLGFGITRWLAFARARKAIYHGARPRELGA
jgi:hypothetical protein